MNDKGIDYIDIPIHTNNQEYIKVLSQKDSIESNKNITIKNKLLKITAVILVLMIAIGVTSPIIAKVSFIGNIFNTIEQNIYSHNFKKRIKLNYGVGNYKIKEISITPFDIVLKSTLPTEYDFLNQTSDTVFDYEVHIYDEDGDKILLTESIFNRFNNRTDIFISPSESSDSLKIVVKKITYTKKSNSESSPSYLATDEEVIDERFISIK